MTFLLDVNVLIALLDPDHSSHEAAQTWFGEYGAEGWATCPITQNGFARIVGSPKYPRAASIRDASASLLSATGRSDHVFWTDDLPLIGSDWIDMAAITSHGQITDSYLLALAASRGGRLATFDRRLSTRAVRDGARALHLIATT